MVSRSIGASIVLGAVVTTLAACGGDSGGDNGSTQGSSPSGSKGATAIKPGKAGGALTVLASADVDYLDPGQTYYTFGYMVHYADNRTLYSFKPDDAEKPVPDIATGPPEISPDNKTITVHIKPGIKYAPPVNRAVTTADIKYAFERAFSQQVPSGYAGTYFTSIVGTPDNPNTGDIKPISGIETPDDTTIVFRLKTPSAPLVSQALVMPITTPVPKEYAAKYDAKTPSTYDQYVAFTGPYMVKNDPKTGKVTGRATSLPPAQVLKQAVTQYKDQALFAPAGGVLYVALNTTVKPFDNVNVRKAIIASSDREALRLTSGGKVSGGLAGGWIPPGLPGYDEAGGPKQDDDLDYLANPKGDPAVAKKYMLAAKEQDPSLPIDAEGKWTGGEKVLSIAGNADPNKKTAEVFQNQMEQLGFKLNLRLVPADTLFTKFCGVPSQNVAICPNVGWFRDFADAQAMLDATFNGDNILQQGNVNWPELDVPAINAAMKTAAVTPTGAARNQAWAKINHMVAEQAPGIPYLWPNNGAVQSKDVVGVINGYYTTPDLNYTSIK
jgi:peptide/nickel transport system substrate-binding protein